MSNNFDVNYRPPSLFDLSSQASGDFNAWGQYDMQSPAATSATKSNGLTPGQTKTVQTGQLLTSVFGALNSAVGSFYAAKTAQYQLQSQASELQFQSGMDAINAHSAEMAAQSIEEQGKAQIEQYTMKAGQEQASQTVATAARGVDLSSASAIDQRASNDLMKQIGMNTINANATRAAWAQRTQATTDRNESLLTGMKAQNALASANTISPGGAMFASAANNFSRIASQMSRRNSSSSFMPSGAGQ